jgi:hypothetical protein
MAVWGEVHGILARKELNGQGAIIMSFDHESQRYVCMLEGGERIKLKATNVRRQINPQPVNPQATSPAFGPPGQLEAKATELRAEMKEEEQAVSQLQAEKAPQECIEAAIQTLMETKHALGRLEAQKGWRIDSPLAAGQLAAEVIELRADMKEEEQAVRQLQADKAPQEVIEAAIQTLMETKRALGRFGRQDPWTGFQSRASFEASTAGFKAEVDSRGLAHTQKYADPKWSEACVQHERKLVDACADQDWGLVLQILKRCPGKILYYSQLHTQDPVTGRLPIHYLLINGPKERTWAVSEIMETCHHGRTAPLRAEYGFSGNEAWYSRDVKSNLPLHWAAKCADEITVTFLLDLYYNEDCYDNLHIAKNADGQTPHKLAKAFNSPRVAALFQKKLFEVKARHKAPDSEKVRDVWNDVNHHHSEQALQHDNSNDFTCSYCSRSEVDFNRKTEGRLKKCICGTAKYCNTDCQRAAWPEHQAVHAKALRFNSGKGTTDQVDATTKPASVELTLGQTLTVVSAHGSKMRADASLKSVLVKALATGDKVVVCGAPVAQPLKAVTTAGGESTGGGEEPGRGKPDQLTDLKGNVRVRVRLVVADPPPTLSTKPGDPDDDSEGLPKDSEAAADLRADLHEDEPTGWITYADHDGILVLDDLSTATTEDAEVQKEIGNTAFKSGDFPPAVVAYSRSIAITPANHLLYSNRSAAHFSAKDYRLAEADAKQCTSLQPGFARGWVRRAVCSNKRDLHDDTQTFYQNAASCSGISANTRKQYMAKAVEAKVAMQRVCAESAMFRSEYLKGLTNESRH